MNRRLDYFRMSLTRSPVAPFSPEYDRRLWLASQAHEEHNLAAAWRRHFNQTYPRPLPPFMKGVFGRFLVGGLLGGLRAVGAEIIPLPVDEPDLPSDPEPTVH